MSSVFSTRNSKKRSQLAWNLISSTNKRTPPRVRKPKIPPVVVYPDFPELYSPTPNQSIP